jgi:transposase
LTDERSRIRYLKDVLRLSFRQIEEDTAISRKRASRIYSLPCEKGPDMKPPYKLEEYRSLLGSWFSETPSLKATQAFVRLRDRDVPVSYPTVARFTRKLRRRSVQAFEPLVFLPGEEGQVDWFFVDLPILGKLCGFALILSYSRVLFAHLYQRHSMEFFLDGHLKAFEALGGYPKTLVYDNLKSVVLRRRPLEYNPHFLTFAHHYRFQIRLCNPASGNEKGRVERAIRTLKETFFNTLSAVSVPAANEALAAWLKTKNETVHRVTQHRPVDLLEEEKLQRLPAITWHNLAAHLPVLPTKTGFLLFDSNAYSVPEYLVGKPLSIQSGPDHLEIYDGEKKVATHPRSFERHRQILNPLHRSLSRMSSQAKRERIFRVMHDMDPVVGQFLAQNGSVGEDPYEAAYQIFHLLRAHSREIILSALRETLRVRSPRLRTLLNLLTPHTTDSPDPVSPRKTELLALTYTPRPLKDYDDTP